MSQLAVDSSAELTPGCIEAEQAVLGAVLYDNDAFASVEHLKPTAFFEPAHARIWDVLSSQINQPNGIASILSVWERMKQDPGLAELGGVSYLADLVDRAPPPAAAAHNAAIVEDGALRRSIGHLAHEIIAQAASTEEDAATVLALLEQRAADLGRTGSLRIAATPVGLSALEMVDAARAGEFVGVPTALNCLDHVTGGIRQDDVWFIGGRTSMGKSVAAVDLGLGLAQQGRGVLMFSLEMPKREVQARLIAAIAYDGERRYDPRFENVRYGDVLKGRGSTDQYERARNAARKLAALPFNVSDVGGLTIDDIRSQALRQMRAWEKAGVERGAVLIDHIGLVKGSGRRNDNKAAETADIVNELKGIAKQIKAPIIALCQVNRNTENRNDKRPTLADLNWSGAIEQIADMICLLYREAYYLERSPDPDEQARAGAVEHEIELLIHKNRSGPICTIKAFCDVACNVIRDLPEARR